MKSTPDFDEVSPTAEVVFREIGDMKLTKRELGRRLGRSSTNIDRWVEELRDAGLLSRRKRENGRRGPNPFEYYQDVKEP